MLEDLMPKRTQEGDVKYAWEDKCPVVLLLDTSGSMEGEPIKELEEGLKLLLKEIQKDETTRQRVEIAVVTFGGTVNVEHDFALAEDIKLPPLKAGGSTPMGEAILKGIELITRRKRELRERGVNYFRPWIVLITDGYPTDMGGGMFDKVKQELEDGERGKHFIIWFFGTEEADFDTLKKLHPRDLVFKLKERKFKEIFKWLSNSITVVSKSAGTGKVNVPNPALSKYITVDTSTEV